MQIPDIHIEVFIPELVHTRQAGDSSVQQVSSMGDISVLNFSFDICIRG